jgi:hypothetical protein
VLTAKQILEELKPLGRDSIKKVLLNHGVREPFFGVKIGDMKNIQKRIKKDYQLPQKRGPSARNASRRNAKCVDLGELLPFAPLNLCYRRPALKI